MCQFFIFGNDPRQTYLAEILADKNISFASAYETNPKWTYLSFEEAMGSCPVILAPLPFTKNQKTISGTPGDGISIQDFCALLHPGQTLFGGCIPHVVTSFCREHDISCFDYMEMEEVRIKNAVATAEGAVCEAIRLSPGTLHKSQGLLAGYGRCGRILAGKLKGLNMQLTILDEDNEKLAQAEADGFDIIRLKELRSQINGCTDRNTPALLHTASVHAPDVPITSRPAAWRYLFNTIPAPVFDKELLAGLPANITIIDIASSPGGVDFDFCKSSGRTAKHCPGLPGRFSPEAAAQVLADAVFSRQT